MARITVEDCLKKIPNRFQLTLAATYRARQLTAGGTPQIDVDPLDRLRALLAHMTTWLDPAGDHRLVVALVPEKILDQAAYAAIAGVFIPGANSANASLPR